MAEEQIQKFKLKYKASGNNTHGRFVESFLFLDPYTIYLCFFSFSTDTRISEQYMICRKLIQWQSLEKITVIAQARMNDLRLKNKHLNGDLYRSFYIPSHPVL